MNQFAPYLAAEAIERDAVELLDEYERARGVVLDPPIPIEDIIEKHLKLRIEFDDMHARHSVPRPANGSPYILGAIYPDGTIFVDESLDPEENPSAEGRYRFTLAHELGHSRLHGELYRDKKTADEPCDPSDMPDFKRAKLTRAEWQANHFASSVLIPRKSLALEWFNWMKSLRPFIFDEWWNDRRWWAPERERQFLGFKHSNQLPNEEVHHFAFNKVAKAIAPIFSVSVEAMRFRLEHLGLLQCTGQSNVVSFPFGINTIHAVDDYINAAHVRVERHGCLLYR